MKITFESDTKIALIKAIRTSYGLGLKEAKDLVEQGCFTNDPAALAEMGNELPVWMSDCRDTLKVIITSDVAGPFMSISLPRKTASSLLAPSFAPPSKSSVTGVAYGAIERRVMAVEQDTANLAKNCDNQLDELRRLVRSLTARVDDLENRPARVIERVSDETAF